MERAAWDELRHRFPLHLLVFKQTASHLPHEANVEQVFSRAGRISDPNMDPAYLGTLVMVGMNKKNYSPPLNAIKELYYSSTANSVNLAACLRTSSCDAAARGSCRSPLTHDCEARG